MTKDRKAKLFFYAVTAAALPPFLILIALMLINPFWFRYDFMDWVYSLNRWFGQWRLDKVEDIRRGYVLTVGDSK